MTRTLFLHIGQPKTGTTHLQALFSSHRDQLAAAGIDYPRYGDDLREVDLRRMVPCGNGRNILVGPRQFEEALAVLPETGSALFSSELMFNLIVEGHGIEWMSPTARRAGFDRIKVLCLLRDPLSSAVSEWQQRVKGSQGETRTLDEFVATAFDGPARAISVLEQLAAQGPYIETTPLRYEFVNSQSDGLEGAVCDWLGLSRQALADAAPLRVNRSLTRSEAELQRQLNTRLGPSGSIFGFRLTVDVLDVEPDPLVTGGAAAAEAGVRLSRDIDHLNLLLPEGHELLLPVSATSPRDPGPKSFTFSEQQLSVLADGIAAHLSDHRRNDRTRGLVRRIRRLLRRTWKRFETVAR